MSVLCTINAVVYQYDAPTSKWQPIVPEKQTFSAVSVIRENSRHKFRVASASNDNILLLEINPTFTVKNSTPTFLQISAARVPYGLQVRQADEAKTLTDAIKRAKSSTAAPAPTLAPAPAPAPTQHRRSSSARPPPTGITEVSLPGGKTLKLKALRVPAADLVVTRGELEAWKEEVLTEVRREISRMKQEILEAL